MSNIEAVRVKDVSKVFGGGRGGGRGDEVIAVDDINITVHDGEFFSLLGPSGCGKTTTLRMIAGFELPSEGEIYIQDRPMGYDPPYKRPVNTVFQNYALWPHMTVFQNVAFGLEMAKVDKVSIQHRVHEALELVQLTGMDRRRPRQLSGGQQQRVALARALVQRPAVLLLDEPLGALDLKLRKAMQLELKHMQKHVGITFIYVTHDQEEALTMSDRIAVMNKGKVLQIDEPAAIYEQPTTRFVADFIGETNFLNGMVVSSDNHSAEVLIDNTITVRAMTDEAVALGAKVTVALRPEKLNIVTDGGSWSSGVQGWIEEAVYIGTDMRYIVRLTDKSSVVARMQNLSSGERSSLQPGSEVVVTWDADSARLLTE